MDKSDYILAVSSSFNKSEESVVIITNWLLISSWKTKWKVLVGDSSNGNTRVMGLMNTPWSVFSSITLIFPSSLGIRFTDFANCQFRFFIHRFNSQPVHQTYTTENNINIIWIKLTFFRIFFKKPEELLQIKLYHKYNCNFLQYF